MAIVEGTYIESYASGWEDRIRCTIDPDEHELLSYGEVLQYRPEVIDEDETFWCGNRIEGDDGNVYAAILDHEYEDALADGEDVLEWLADGVAGFVVIDLDELADTWSP